MSSSPLFKSILENHAIIEASAGTGKTYSIVEMFKILIQERLLEPDPFSDILLLTYTVKATKELKIRIQNAIYELYDKEKDKTFKYKYLELINQIGNIKVYTIYGFLYQSLLYLGTPSEDLLSNPFNDTDMREDAVILNKAKEYFYNLYQGKSYYGLLEGYNLKEIQLLVSLSDLKYTNWENTFLREDMFYIKDYHAYKPRNFFLKVINNYEYIYTIENNDPIVSQFNIPLFSKKEFNNHINHIKQKLEIWDIQERKKILIDFKVTKALGKVIKLVNNLLLSTDIFEQIKFLNIFEKEYTKENIKSLHQEKYNSINIKLLESLLLDIMILQNQIFIYLSLCIAKDTTQINPMAYSMKGGIYLANQKAYQIKSTDSISFFNFSHIFIDEFQDTNILEWETLKLLFFKRKKIPHIYIIGDPKQAIYKFKGSDVNAYQKAKEDLSQKGGKTFVLDINYRTQPELLTLFNTLFTADFFSKNIYKPLIAGKKEDLQLKHYLYLTSLNILKDKNPEKKTIEFTNDQMNKVCQTILDDILKEQENSNHLHIAILSKQHKHLKRMALFLEKNKINYAYTGEKGLWSSLEAKAIQVFFASLYSSFQMDMILVLKTPFFNYSHISQDPQKQFELFLSDLFLYKNWAYKKQWALLRAYLLYQSPLFFHTESKEFFIYEQIIDHIISYMYESKKDLEYLYFYLKTQTLPQSQNTKNNEYQPYLTQGSLFIELLTIHQSKGLEFDNVYLLEDFSQDEVEYPIIFKNIGEGGVYSSQIYLKDSLNRNDQKVLAEEKEQLEKEKENQNLLYVALTRAKYKLFLVYPAGNQDHFLVKALNHIKEQPGVFVKDLIYSNKPMIIEKNESLLPPKVENSLNLRDLPSFKERTWQMVSYTSLLKEFPKPILPHNDTDNKNDNTILTLLPAGAKTGIFLHTLLENIKWNSYNSLSDYVKDMMHKYSFIDVPFSIVENIKQNGVKTIFNSKEGKELLQDNGLRNFFLYHSDQIKGSLKNFINYSEGLFHGEILEIINRLLAIVLPHQKRNLHSIISTLSEQEMTVSFLPTQDLLHRYIESTLDLVFVGDDNKIYFLDWKTDHLSSYKTKDLEHHIHTQYTLQWKIYLIALEKFLKIYLKDFSYTKHIGGFYYIFARGVYDASSYGVYFKAAPAEEDFSKIKLEIKDLLIKENQNSG